MLEKESKMAPKNQPPQQQQLQLQLHPIDLGIAIKGINAIFGDPTFNQPEDLIKILGAMAQVSMAIDTRRMADHATRVTLHNLSMLEEQEQRAREAAEKDAAEKEEAEKNKALEKAVAESGEIPPPGFPGAGTVPMSDVKHPDPACDPIPATIAAPRIDPGSVIECPVVDKTPVAEVVVASPDGEAVKVDKPDEEVFA